MRTISISSICKIATDSTKKCHKIKIVHLILYCDTSLESQDFPLYVGVQYIKICFVVLNISSLTTQSWHIFGTKCDTSFNVYLMLNLPRFRNSWMDLYKQHIF